MAQILLHKQALTDEQVDRLAREGVIAIHTKRPQDFTFLDCKVPQIEMNDMVWALLDGIDGAVSHQGVAARLIKNLASIANEKRKKVQP